MAPTSHAILFPVLWPIGTTAPVYRRPYGTYALMGLNIIFFTLATAWPEPMLQTFALGSEPRVHHYLTYALLHEGRTLFGLTHLAVNLLFLWLFGAALENRTGWAGLLSTYAAAAVIGGITHQSVNGLADAPLVGASAAVYGVIGAYMILFPYSAVKCLCGLVLLVVPVYVRVVNVLAITFVAMFWGLNWLVSWLADYFKLAGETGRVSTAAHVGGLLAGILVTIAFHGLHAFTQAAREEEANERQVRDQLAQQVHAKETKKETFAFVDPVKPEFKDQQKRGEPEPDASVRVIELGARASGTQDGVESPEEISDTAQLLRQNCPAWPAEPAARTVRYNPPETPATPESSEEIQPDTGAFTDFLTTPEPPQVEDEDEPAQRTDWPEKPDVTHNPTYLLPASEPRYFAAVRYMDEDGRPARRIIDDEPVIDFVSGHNLSAQPASIRNDAEDSADEFFAQTGHDEYSEDDLPAEDSPLTINRNQAHYTFTIPEPVDFGLDDARLAAAPPDQAPPQTSDRYAVVAVPNRPLEMAAAQAVLGPALGLGAEATRHAIRHRRGILCENLAQTEAETIAERFTQAGQAVLLASEDEVASYGEPLDVLACRDEERAGLYQTMQGTRRGPWERAVLLAAGMVILAPGAPGRAVLDLFYHDPRLHLRLWENTLQLPHLAHVPESERFRLLALAFARKTRRAIHSRTLKDWLDDEAAFRPIEPFHSLIEYENYLRWHLLAGLSSSCLCEALKPPAEVSKAI